MGRILCLGGRREGEGGYLVPVFSTPGGPFRSDGYQNSSETCAVRTDVVVLYNRFILTLKTTSYLDMSHTLTAK